MERSIRDCRSATGGKKLDRLPYRVWCLCGDSEMAEGSMWESIQHAGWEGLENLTAIIDVNRLGQTRETMLGWDLDGYVRRFEAFGWNAIEIDGHDVDAIDAAYGEAEPATGADGDHRPHQEGQGRRRRSRTSPASTASRSTTRTRRSPSSAAIATCRSAAPTPRGRRAARFDAPAAQLPTWELGDEVATRKAYGEALTALGSSRGDVVALDGEVSQLDALRGLSARPTRTATSRCSSPSSR